MDKKETKETNELVELNAEESRAGGWRQDGSASDRPARDRQRQ